MSYKDIVLPIIRATRPILLPEWSTAEIIYQKTKLSGDIVTALDHQVESFLKQKLAEAYPDVAFVGEERGGDRSRKRFWLVDPIDGTGHYVRGLPFCTTMLALIENDQVVFSAIYDFLNDDIYWAEKGKGAFLNDDPIHVNSRELREAYICVETKVIKSANQTHLGKIAGKASYMFSVCSGWEFAMVACGKLGAKVVFDPWGSDYDFAAGSLLIAEAGGTVQNIRSENYDYRNTDFIAGNSDIVAGLQEIFKDYKHPE